MPHTPLRPAPPPLRVPMVTLTWIGMGLWAVALAVTSAVTLAGDSGALGPATCLTGLLIGIPTLRWSRRHQ